MPTCTQCGQKSPDTFGFCPACGAPLVAEAAAREVRKVVTVLFCDLTGSTALGERTDPEVLRALMNRYYDAARTVLERHGGTVEKFVGDAVMAVFGIPVASEDDALRATRAAVELRDVVHEIGLEARIGVNTGPVVAGRGDTLVTGDAVNVAARLEQSAGSGEILLGETTHGLVRDAVQTEPSKLEVKGKSASLPMHRLIVLDTSAGGVSRRLDRPIVGRRRERDRLRADFDEVVEGSACRLFSLIGPAGVGKSRLVQDFLEQVGETATVARSRALSYGEGITYWPLVEMLVQLGVKPDQVILSSPADTQLATRALFERLAEERPLVLVLDDVHWAEAPMLDLVEHVVDWSRGRPIFLLCVARPELLDVRPGWGGGKLNATSVLLEPLPDEAAAELAASLLAGVELDVATRARILEAAEGNPLFLEEMASLARDANGVVEVPPTVQALLQARLDTLDDSERAVVDCGAVEGKVFHRGAVTALAPEGQRGDVPGRLLSLVRKEVVRPDRARIPGDDAFRFRHLLIRDTAYESLPKAVRAELHERFAEWLESHGALYEQDEIVGYHLERAIRYCEELDPGDPRVPGLTARAAAHLGAAGCAAFERDDMNATRALLRRTLALTPRPDDPRLIPYLLHALLESADDTLALLIEDLGRHDDRDRHVAFAFDVMTRPAREVEESIARLEEGRTTCIREGDTLRGAYCDIALAFVYWGECQTGKSHLAYRRAYDAIRPTGPATLERWLIRNLVMTASFVGEHVDELGALASELEEMAGEGEPLSVATVRGMRARIDYLSGRIDFATVRAACEDEITLLEQTGLWSQSWFTKHFARDVLPWLEGDAEARERGARAWVADAERSAPIYLPNALGQWALALCDLGQGTAALEAVERGRALVSAADVADHVVLDAAEGYARALRGDADAARALLDRAHARADGIDMAVVTDELDHVDAAVSSVLGHLERARTLLIGLIERNEGRGRGRFADRYRRDLDALA